MVQVNLLNLLKLMSHQVIIKTVRKASLTMTGLTGLPPKPCLESGLNAGLA
jgi:hypothetical protein